MPARLSIQWERLRVLSLRIAEIVSDRDLLQQRARKVRSASSFCRNPVATSLRCP